MRRTLILFSCLLAGIFSPSYAQETNISPDDSAKAASDSMVQVLTTQVQELQMQRILLQEQLERTGENARADSLIKAQRRQRIDSLRHVTTGSPLVVEGDTLLTLYARSGGMLPEARVKAAGKVIEELAHKLFFHSDSLYVFESDFSTDIMAGNSVILSITDTDGIWENKPREQLAKEFMAILQQKVSSLHETYGMQKKIRRIAFALLLIIGQLLLIKLTIWLFARWRRKVMRRTVNWIKPIKIKDYELLNVHRQGVALMFMYKVLRILCIILQLFISVPVLFSIFPETKTFTYTMIGYVWNPVKDVLSSLVDYLPNLFKIIVIFLCFRYLVRGMKYFADEIASGRLKINGFYSDWAAPTFYILRVLSYALMLVMIWPLLPNSNSAIFQGVSVFLGLIISLGSTAIIGNIMAGLVMTYMRPFHIGDYIKVGDIVGEVIEKNILVTRIRTRKNEVVTIQNSNMLSAQTSNFTEAAKTFGIIVHTKVTIGYDVPWQLIKEIMEGAALDTNGVKKTPKPFMMTTALDDFYVEYEINAYTDNSAALPRIYSELHQNLLKRFFEAGVEIMSPHIYARRDGIDTQMPSDYLQPGERKTDE